MNVLQFSISYSLNSDTIDSDMAEALVKAGHKVGALSMKFQIQFKRKKNTP